ncbi:conserved exported protein of unknown function [Tenacibaculum sp. 190130A14a]|uniref:SdiA-regulated protein n=1 Tax=Tenacibaculum polynesiense TaxID=3137857 RepID=A0ABP1EYS8_9FLAO
MKKFVLYFVVVLFLCSCNNYGQLKLVADLPKKLKEVSGTEYSNSDNVIWMLNDSGNKPQLFAISTKGKTEKVLEIQAKNNDWEDLTSDEEGNLYIADFGNNANARQNLVILKVNKQELSKKNVEVEKIHFSYPDQTKFPPKKKKCFFDAESIFFKDGYLYIFTKSRVKKHYGKTSLYKIPAKEGNYEAKLVGEFNNCDDMECWVTSAAISPDKEKVVLLTHEAVLLFTEFDGDNFFNGTLTELPFQHISQKEGVSFKDNNTLYITDERSHGKGGNLYEFSLKW